MSKRLATVADWAEKQHYKKGRGTPPWIKLHRNLLNSRRFQTLPLASKALAPQIWLLASENDGVVDIDIDELEFKLRWPRAEIEAGLKPLIDKEYLILLADCKQDDAPETETEAETELGAKAPSSANADCETSDENVRRETIAAALREYREAVKNTPLPKPQGTERQRKLIWTRLKSHGPDAWNTVCAKIRGSPFLQGKTGREGWPGATLDWACNLTNFEKIMDGNYDNLGKSKSDSQYGDFLKRGAPAGDVDELREGADRAEDLDCSGGEPVPHLRLAAGR